MKKFLPVILVVVGLLMAFNKPIMGLISPANLQISINRPPVIMPSIYKVYENEDALNGKYSLFQMVITNTSDLPAKNVEVSYNVSNFIDWTVAEKIPLIQPGQTVVVNCYPHFPDKIVEKMTGSKETVQTTVKGSNIKTQENNFSIAVKGRNDFMYTFLNGDEIRTSEEYFDNKPLLSCLVTPEDPIIKYLTQQIQEKVLKGEEASVGNKETEGVRVIQGIYYATLVSHMVYSGTSGVPEKISDVSSIVQTIRLPREVITGRTGLCIELSLLYASIMMNTGMDPVVYLIPGHAYPGFRMNGSYYALEATAIGGEGLGGRSNPQQAYEAGMKELERDWPKFQNGADGYAVVDIREAIKNGAVAMELKDDNFLRQKIDEIAKTFDPAQAQISTNVNANSGVNDNGGGGGNDGGGGGGNDDGGGNGGGNGGSSIPSGYRVLQDVVTVAYPGSWHMVPRSQYTVPQSRYVFANSANNADLEVYSFPGYTNPGQALVAINQWVNKFGYQLKYQTTGQAKGYTVYSGQTLGSGGGLNWVAAFKATGNGVVGIATGANINTGTTHQQTVMKILNSLQ
jgi:hypothetical protein